MINEYYTRFRVRDYIQSEKIDEYENILDCSLGTNPFIKKQNLKKYIKEVTSLVNEYPINSYTVLKKELLKLYRNILNKNIDEKNISFGSGTMGIIRNLSEFLIEKNTKVLGVAPQFTRFISEVELKQGIYEYYELDKNQNYKFIASDFIKKISKDYSLIYIDNPNNPTGQIIDIKDIEKIVRKANEYGIITIIDEAYGDYMKFENSSISLIGNYPNLVVIRSASKFYGLPNHRIGYMFGDKEFIKIYNEISIPFPFSDLSANIFVNAIRDYEVIEKTKEKVIKANEYIFNVLDAGRYLYTSMETPIFTLKTDVEKDLEQELINRNVKSESGKHFMNLDKNYARIRVNKEYKKLLKIIKEI